MSKEQHIWNFSSVGGVKRVNIESGADLLALSSLDQKLWTALSCPVHGLEIDTKTLELMDADKDGRIRVPEVLEAVRWITSLMEDPSVLLKPSDALPLSYICKDTEEGKNLYASALHILRNLELPDATSIGLAETSDLVKIFAKTIFNGDGIVTEDAAEPEQIKMLFRNMILCTGSVTDRCGKEGISRELSDKFFDECSSYDAWNRIAEQDKANILPFSDSTAQAFELFKALQPKIEDYFLRCRLTEFDPESGIILNSLAAGYEALRPKDLSTCVDEIATYPLAKNHPTRTLVLDAGINPAWENKLRAFIQITGVKDHTLTETAWNLIAEKFTAHARWQADKKGASVEALGLTYIRELLSSGMKETVEALIDRDKALEAEAEHMILVDKMVRYYRDIFSLLRNFVTFHDFYSPDTKAIFQNGTLYLEQRSLDLCLKVSDMPKHNAMVSLSGMYLLYCDCISKSRNEKMTIVAALTNGDTDNLVVGRNAVFYDRKGNDWDATVVKIVENPISIRQAFWSPYRKVARFIEKQVDNMASAKEKQIHATGTGHVEKIAAKPEDVAKAPPPFDVGKFVGIFAAIGLALGAIGGVLASFLGGFLGLTWWKMPFAVIGIFLAISGPSMIIAWLKLRKRNLAPLLDANGWAINARATVNIVFGNTLTHLVALPAGAKVNLNDPFTAKKRPLVPFLIAFLVLAAAVAFVWWRYGNLKSILSGIF